MGEKGTENFIVGGGVLQRNPDGSFTEVESFATNIGMNSHELQDEKERESVKNNMRLRNIPWIETVPKKYFSPIMRDMCIVPYCNNYLKMHGKHKIRQVAGRKRKRKFNNQFSKNVRNKMRIYLKRKRKGIKHKKNRRLM